MNEALTKSEYLANIKEGDSVFIQLRANELIKRKVSRVTKTQIVLQSSERYNRASGQQIGGIQWQSNHITMPTETVRANWQAAYLSSWAQSTLPGIFAGLTTQQKLALYNHVLAVVESNKP